MILVTGGSGRLGIEIKKTLKNGFYPSSTEFDITKSLPEYPCNSILHMAAYTNVDRAEIEREKCILLNTYSVFNLLTCPYYKGKYFIFISTEQVNGKGVYFESKALAEGIIRNLAHRYLIIRTLFKPRPFPWPEAWVDQMTCGDYTDVISDLIVKEINNWDGNSKTVYVGTKRKSLYELALQTRPDVKPVLMENYKGLPRPKDYV